MSHQSFYTYFQTIKSIFTYTFKKENIKICHTKQWKRNEGEHMHHAYMHYLAIDFNLGALSLFKTIGNMDGFHIARSPT